uniref:Cytochrome P450 n=1 Tax=Acrobeloides nanus TaxID=290746 RepID=A0A914C730_9BILA
MRDEVMEVIGDKTEIDYDDITKLKYINQVVQETLRMYPPAARSNRLCTKPITINGIHFDKDVAFSIPVYAIHHDEKYYPDPYKFDPDRFAPEEKAKRDPLTYLPFGYGPRNCIGMRFAYFEIWMTLAHLLKNYRFYSIPGSPDLPIKLNTQGITKPEETLYVRAERIYVD